MLNSTSNMIKIKIFIKFMIIFASREAEEGFSNMSIPPQSAQNESHPDAAGQLPALISRM